MDVSWPTPNRLRVKFAAIGPYFRKEQSQDDNFFFDCLAVCVSAKPAAELREFYGWWLTLQRTESGFEYHYQVGKYNEQGDWEVCKLSKKNDQEVAQSLDTFYQKLSELLNELQLPIRPSQSLSEKQSLSAI